MKTRRNTTIKRRREVYLKKLTIALSVIVLAMGLGVAFGSNPVSAHDNFENLSVEKKYYKSVEISYGDTLWDIAEEYMNDDCESVKAYVEEIKEINGLLSDDIHEGQYLTVPYFEVI